jgi:hypothetical protein
MTLTSLWQMARVALYAANVTPARAARHPDGMARPAQPRHHDGALPGAKDIVDTL